MDEEDIDEACAASLRVPRAWRDAPPGAQLRALRVTRGISQRQLADESGFSPSFVCRLEKGGDAPWATWRRLFWGLGFDAVLTPMETCEESEDLLREERERRKDRAEAGRLRRW